MFPIKNDFLSNNSLYYQSYNKNDPFISHRWGCKHRWKDETIVLRNPNKSSWLNSIPSNLASAYNQRCRQVVQCHTAALSIMAEKLERTHMHQNHKNVI